MTQPSRTGPPDDRPDTPDTPEGAAWQWQSKRHCCLTPMQCLISCMAAMAFNALVGAVFWVWGYPAVGCFVALETCFVLACLFSYARHAGDRETIMFRQGYLDIEVRSGGRVQRTVLHAGWVRIENGLHPHALVSLTERGTTVQVGRHMPPPLRTAMTRELSQALRHTGATKT